MSVAYSPALASQFTATENDADASDTVPIAFGLCDAKVGNTTALVDPDVTLHPRIVTLIVPAARWP